MDQLVQQLVNGLTLGCVYALAALSFTLIFGVLRLVNFALGELMMLGAFCSLGAARYLQTFSWFQNNPAAFALAAVICGILGTITAGFLVEWLAFRPLRRKPGTPPLLGLISSLGVSIALQNIVLIYVDSGQVNYPRLLPDIAWTWGGVRISLLQFAIITGALCFMSGLSYLVYRTKLGKEIRAVRDNPILAAQQGTDVERIIRRTFLLASVLAAVAGMMIGLYDGVAKYNMGFLPAIKAFTAAILGGVGDVPGGMLGGVTIGLLESFSGGFISTAYKDVLTFVALIAILMFRPRGLLNRGIE